MTFIGDIVGEEDTRNTTLSMGALLVTLSLVVAALETALVAGSRVLVCLHAAVVDVAEVAKPGKVLALSGVVLRWRPAQRQVCSGHNLDKIHKVIVGVAGALLGIVERVQVVVGPRVVLRVPRSNIVGELRTEAQLVNLVLERVRNWAVEVVLQVVDVNHAVAETAAGGEVEVANDLVDADRASNTAPFVALLIKLFRIVLTLALLHVLATAKSPAFLCVCLADLVASVAASCFLDVVGGHGTVARTAVVGIEVGGLLSLVVDSHSHRINDSAALVLRLKAKLLDTGQNSVLLLARNVHDVEREQLAGDLGERDIHVNFHALSSALVHNELWVDDNSPVVTPFAPR